MSLVTGSGGGIMGGVTTRGWQGWMHQLLLCPGEDDGAEVLVHPGLGVGLQTVDAHLLEQYTGLL